MFERVTEGGTTKYRHFIEDIAVVTTTETSSDTTHEIGFMHRDRLGSTVAIGDQNGNLKETHSFDPFGKPRLGNITDKLPSILDSQYTTRGFTDHEHLDSVELIHANGRAYDYNLGRFLSTDPVIQDPGNSQSLNPYSYIMNNPLAGTDPSGYVSCDAGKAGECDAVASDLGKGEKADITQKQSVTGSRIQQNVKVGTMTGNGNGTVSVQTGAGSFTASTDIGSQKNRENIADSGQLGQGTGSPTDSGGHGVNIGRCASESKCHPGDFSDKEKAGIQSRTDNMTSDLRKASHGSMKSALEALHESGVPALANEYGLEFWAHIDGETHEIYRVSTGFDKGFAYGSENLRNPGDIIWHTHPSGKDVWAGDLQSAVSHGASWIFASGNRMTGIQNPNFKDRDNPSQKRFKEMGGMKTRALMYDGRWHNGTTTISPY